jgi:cytochrome c oxidase subunit 2
MKHTGLLLFVIGVAAGVAGCSGNQSVLNPKSNPAAELTQLSWVLFALGALVLLIVVVAIALAYVGTQAVRSALASHGMVVSGGIAFPVIVLTVLLGYGVWLTRGSQARLNEETSLRIKIVGEQWWWRIAYEDREGQSIVSANELRIPVGRPALLELTSADVIHSFWVPNLAGKLDMMPGRTTRLRLEANESGIYRGQCAEYCGGPHALMAFEVVAMPPEEFDAWLKRQTAPANDPATPAARRGRDLFMSAGCGACHSIRGTGAVGTIGPDLTHLGSRRSVGLDTNGLSATTVANFIRDGQHIKPGNLMPPYRIFNPDDLSALSIYLSELK